MTDFSQSDLLSAVKELLPKFKPTGRVEKLSGGNINHVWRVYGESGTLIAKHAPPHIASNPDVPLSSQRITFEANALKLFEPDGLLSSVSDDEIRPPKLLAFDSDHSLLLMEDIGGFTELGNLDLIVNPPESVGDKLGRFIGNLHKMTLGNHDLKKSFHNSEIQRVRFKLQYESAHEYANVDDQNLKYQIKEKSQSLGKSLQKAETGKCLLMGDLWPPSVFVNQAGNIRLIDWEFVHYGRPLQDLGHFAAHCWMQGHIQLYKTEENHWLKLWEAFLQKYKAVTGETYHSLMNADELEMIGIHIGTEILVRTYGPFRKRYNYDSFDENHPLLMDAKETAIGFIINPSKSEVLFQL